MSFASVDFIVLTDYMCVGIKPVSYPVGFLMSEHGIRLSRPNSSPALHFDKWFSKEIPSPFIIVLYKRMNLSVCFIQVQEKGGIRRLSTRAFPVQLFHWKWLFLLSGENIGVGICSDIELPDLRCTSDIMLVNDIVGWFSIHFAPSKCAMLLLVRVWSPMEHCCWEEWICQSR